ncbi:isochorismatase family protein [Methylibium sp.]|uniref:isochorismatase family protein n=1 Tax=Methylibium sp. TaxID=2067992 RepID=UPI0033414DFE
MMTNAMSAPGSTLVLVDFQQRLMPAIAHADEVLAQATLLARAARLLGIRTLGTEQNPIGLGPSVESLRQFCESSLSKMHFDACADGLSELIRTAGGATAGDVVLAGCEAHVCLLQTALGLLRAGHGVWVVAPACGSRKVSDHALAMQRLREAGAGVVSTEMVVFEWLHSCRHPRFKEVLALLKTPAA